MIRDSGFDIEHDGLAALVKLARQSEVRPSTLRWFIGFVALYEDQDIHFLPATQIGKFVGIEGSQTVARATRELKRLGLIERCQEGGMRGWSCPLLDKRPSLRLVEED